MPVLSEQPSAVDFQLYNHACGWDDRRAGGSVRARLPGRASHQAPRITCRSCHACAGGRLARERQTPCWQSGPDIRSKSSCQRDIHPPREILAEVRRSKRRNCISGSRCEGECRMGLATDGINLRRRRSEPRPLLVPARVYLILPEPLRRGTRRPPREPASGHLCLAASTISSRARAREEQREDRRRTSELRLSACPRRVEDPTGAGGSLRLKCEPLPPWHVWAIPLEKDSMPELPLRRGPCSRAPGQEQAVRRWQCLCPWRSRSAPRREPCRNLVGEDRRLRASHEAASFRHRPAPLVPAPTGPPGNPGAPNQSCREESRPERGEG